MWAYVTHRITNLEADLENCAAQRLSWTMTLSVAERPKTSGA